MKTRATEMTLCAVLLVGSTAACSEQQNTPPVPTVQENTHGDLQYAGKQLLQSVLKDPKHSEDKPPYTVSITRELGHNAQVSYAVQTATKAHSSSNIDSIEIVQKGPGVANFDLSFLLRKDDTWNTYCKATSPLESMAEIGEQTVEYDGKTVSNYGTAEAKVILSDEVSALEMAISDLQQQPSTELNPLYNPCHPNLG